MCALIEAMLGAVKVRVNWGDVSVCCQWCSLQPYENMIEVITKVTADFNFTVNVLLLTYLKLLKYGT